MIKHLRNFMVGLFFNNNKSEMLFPLKSVKMFSYRGGGLYSLFPASVQSFAETHNGGALPNCLINDAYDKTDWKFIVPYWIIT